MPVAFPSHQGLILPLWRRFPHAIDAVALSVGAAMPDVIDACAWPFRGELGQLVGHSLVGCVIACLPVGLVLTWLALRVVPRRFLARLDFESPPGVFRPVRAAVSVFIGALSHVFFDLVTHSNFVLLWPWYTSDDFFPDWWKKPWATIPVPVYKEPYPLAPHTVVWFVLSVVGAYLFFRCLRPKVTQAERD